MVTKSTVASAALAGLLGFVATTAVYLKHRDIVVDFERGYEGAFVESFHPRERAEGKFFRWTTGESYLAFRNVPATGTVSVEARLKTIRPGGVALPELAFTVNGVTVHRARALPGSVTYHFDFPSADSRLTLGIESETFEAGGGRDLGVQVLSVTVSLPDGHASWVGPALWMAIAAALLALAFAATRVHPWVALGGVLVTVLGFVYLLAQQAVRFTHYARDVALLALVLLALISLACYLLDRTDWLHRKERGELVALLAMLFLIKLAVVTCPLMLSSDADFQANRMSELLAGNWHPTSVLFITLNREDFSFVIHLDRQPRTSRRREAQTGSRARSGSRSERTLDAVEHSRTLMEWWPFLIFHRGGLRIKVINNTPSPSTSRPFAFPIRCCSTSSRRLSRSSASIGSRHSRSRRSSSMS